jgi:hypothetical protein
MRLQLCTWPEVENYLKTSRGIILPIGSTEQHGPNGLIGTDAICAEEIALGVGKATGGLVGPTLREKGLVFVGIDVIGDYLTEINVTSPTGIQEINQLDGVQLEVSLWDAMERRYHEQHSSKPA